MFSKLWMWLSKHVLWFCFIAALLSFRFFPVEGDHDIIGVLLIKPLSVGVLHSLIYLLIISYNIERA